MQRIKTCSDIIGFSMPDGGLQIQDDAEDAFQCEAIIDGGEFRDRA